MTLDVTRVGGTLVAKINDILTNIVFVGFRLGRADPQIFDIRSAVKQLYSRSDDARSVLNKILETELTINYVEHEFSARGLKAFTLDLDLDSLDSRRYITKTGTIEEVSVAHGLMHELMHAVLGLRDPTRPYGRTNSDYEGATVLETNKVLRDLHEPERLSYTGTISSEAFRNTESLTFGRTIDIAYSSSRYLSGDEPGGVETMLQPQNMDTSKRGESDDLLVGSRHKNVFKSGDGKDFLYGRENVDRLHGGEGEDYLNGGDHLDYLYGGADRDVLDGGLGGDELRGGTENDFYIVDQIGDKVVEAAGQGNDTIRFVHVSGVRRADISVSIKNVEYLHMDTPFAYTREVTQNQVGWVKLSSGNDRLEFHAAATRKNATVFELGSGADDVAIVPHGFRSFLGFHFKGATSNDSVDLSAFDIDGKVLSSATASSGKWLLAPRASIFDPTVGEEGAVYTNTNPGWDLIDLDSARWLATFNGLRSGNFDL